MDLIIQIILIIIAFIFGLLIGLIHNHEPEIKLEVSTKNTLPIDKALENQIHQEVNYLAGMIKRKEEEK